MRHDGWSDPKFVADWHRRTLAGNPLRREQLDLVVDLVADRVRGAEQVIDLGSGTGIFAGRLLRRCSRVRVFGVDASQPMNNFARRRLQAYGDRFQTATHDLNRIETLELPGRPRFFVSILTLHELAPDRRRALFAYVRRRLVPRGMLVINDKLEVDLAHFRDSYESLWRRLEARKRAGPRVTFRAHVASRFFRDGHVVPLEVCCAELRAAGFHAACVQLYLNRAVIVARKR